MTTGASQADMTLIMVCESTRPRVPRETTVSSVAQRVVARHSDHEKLVDDDCSRECRKNVAQALGKKFCAGDVGEVDGEAHR